MRLPALTSINLPPLARVGANGLLAYRSEHYGRIYRVVKISTAQLISTSRHRALASIGRNPYRSQRGPEKHLEVLLRGGLGNQLFSFAAGLEVANALEVPLHFVTRYLDGSKQSGRNFELMEVIPANYSWGEDSYLSRYFKEKSFLYDPLLKEVQTGTLLEGYFQSSRYFASSVPMVKQMISASKQFRRGLAWSERQPFIALQVRRGDYLSPHNRKVHGVVPLSFFEKGLDILRAQVGWLPAVVFSDDYRVADSLAQRLKNCTPFPNDGARTSLEVLGALGAAKALCISNSSFGWWGAFMAGPGENVITPRPWFATGAIDSRDLLEGSWLSLGHSN
jgi:hypothetical protein